MIHEESVCRGRLLRYAVRCAQAVQGGLMDSDEAVAHLVCYYYRQHGPHLDSRLAALASLLTTAMERLNAHGFAVEPGTPPRSGAPIAAHDLLQPFDWGEVVQTKRKRPHTRRKVHP